PPPAGWSLSSPGGPPACTRRALRCARRDARASSSLPSVEPLAADQLGVEADGALCRLGEVAEVQALVFAVGVGVRILDADEQRRRAAQLLAEGLDEGEG